MDLISSLNWMTINFCCLILLVSLLLRKPTCWTINGNKLRIDGIYEDELTAYFVVFSNGNILYIYQSINGDEKIRQEMRFVLPSDSDYKDIVSYMNEEWIDVWYSKAGSINNIIFSLGDKTCK